MSTYLAEFLDDLSNEFLAILVVGNVELVGLSLDLVALHQLLGITLTTFSSGSIGDGDISTELSATTSSLNAHTFRAGCASDDNDFAFEAEEIEQALGFRDLDRHGECFEGL